MKDIVQKIKLLLLPYSICLVSLLIGYTFLHWLIIIKFELFLLKDDLINFFIPGGIALVLVVFIMRPQIKKLKFKNDNGSFFLYMIAVLGFAVPTIIAQEYIDTATGKLTFLNTIDIIDVKPKSKYYNLKNYYLFKSAFSFKTKIETSGKNDQYLNFTLYVVQPILKSSRDTVNNSTHYWFCSKYQDQISNNLSSDEKERAFKSFLETSELRFKNETHQFTYLERLGLTNDTKFYGNAASYSELERDGQDIFLIACHGDFSERNGNKLSWIFKSSLLSLLIWTLLLLCFKLKTNSELKSDKRRIQRQKAKGWRKKYELLIPHEGFYISLILIYSIIVIYVLMIISGYGFVKMDNEGLYKWGALFRPAVQDGEWWRLFSCQFLHANIMHLLNNLLSLYFISFFLEPLLGRWRYIIIFLICGLCASILSIFWHENTLSVGASGAIFGMYGFMLALILMKVFEPQLNRFFLTIAGLFVGINLIMGIVGNVDNAAHIGGLIAGFFIGILLSPKIEDELEVRNNKK